MFLPRVGLGVYQIAPGAATQQAVSQAITLGYRHIDTATLYGNEAGVGQAVTQSYIPRTEIVVTTKLWNQDQGYDKTLKAFEQSRRLLGLEVVDLYLLHWPVPRLRLASWQALETLYQEGKVRAIGVSNFMIPHLQELFAHARILPAVNQIEVHPFFQQREVRAFCQQHNIVVEAYSPLAKAERFRHPVIQRIAQAHQIQAAQVMLAWGLQHDLVVLPKSTHTARQQANLASLHIQLTPGDMQALDNLEEGFVTDWDPRFAP
jgi:diketogulonate reductase-like aldo/keto reductase